MALHPASCQCNACQELGESRAMGYPAYEDAEHFPVPERWHRSPMKPPRWGLDMPWDGGDVRFSKTMGSDFAFDPSDFGSHRARASMGQAFVPGTQPPSIPDVLAELQASGQGPDASTGISPTLSIADARRAAAAQGLTINSDGSYSPANPQSGSLAPWIIGGLAALLLLK